MPFLCPECTAELETDDLYPERLWCWSCCKQYEVYGDTLIGLRKS